MADNIKPSTQDQKQRLLQWDAANREASLDVLYEETERRAMEAIDWYQRRKEAPKRASQIMRGTAIVLFAFGGFAPVLASAQRLPFDLQDSIAFHVVGYICIAAATAALALDRFGGFSTAWMRYISTNLRLQKLVTQFRIDWQIARARLQLTTDPAQQRASLDDLLQQLRKLTVDVLTEVEQETQTWVGEFRQSLSELQRSVKEEGDKAASAIRAAQQSGSLRVEVANFADVKTPVHVFVDDVPRIMKGGTLDIASVVPGPRKIAIRTAVDATNVVEETADVQVSAGAQSLVRVKLTI